MSHLESALDIAIDSTASSFVINPANYSDERSLAEDVRLRLCAVLPQATVAAVTVDESSVAQGSFPDHEEYTGQYRETKEIDRAQCEVGGTEFPFRAQERLDLGLFLDGLSLTVDGGTQEFLPTDLAAAAAFKYVKNTNYLRYRPDDDNSKYRDIADDITRLGDLPQSVICRCVVFANYDLLRRDQDTDAEQGLYELAEENGVALCFVFPEPVGVKDT